MRWQSLGISSIRSSPFACDMHRMFDDFASGDPIPTVDIQEDARDVVIVAEVLTIKGEKRTEREAKDGHTTYRERHFGAFLRSLRLPFDAGDERVDAKFRNGVLTVRVAKPAHLQRAVALRTRRFSGERGIGRRARTRVDLAPRPRTGLAEG